MSSPEGGQTQQKITRSLFQRLSDVPIFIRKAQKTSYLIHSLLCPRFADKTRFPEQNITNIWTLNFTSTEFKCFQFTSLFGRRSGLTTHILLMFQCHSSVTP